MVIVGVCINMCFGCVRVVVCFVSWLVVGWFLWLLVVSVGFFLFG